MKKKIINGILLVAMLFAATTSFVSCKDNVDDEILPVYAQLTQTKNELSNRISTLEGDIANLQSELNNVKGDVATIKQQIADLQSEVSDLKSRLANVESQIATLSTEVDNMKKDLQAIDARLTAVEGVIAKLVEFFDRGLVTEIAVNQTVNDAIGTINLPGVNVKMLAALFGKNDTYIEKFPATGKDYNVFPKGDFLTAEDIAGAEFIDLGADYITKPNGNAGKFFFTANSMDNSTFDINNWTLTLENSVGKTAPVNFTNVQPSDYDVQWGIYKSDVLGSNEAAQNIGFYEADATIDAQYLEQCKLNGRNHVDYKAIKDEVNQAVENIKAAKGAKAIVTSIAKEAVKLVENIFSGNMSGDNRFPDNPTYSPQRLVMTQAVDESYVRFQDADLDVALTAVSPLSYNSFWTMENNVKKPSLDLIERAVNKVAKAIKKQLPKFDFSNVNVKFSLGEIDNDHYILVGESDLDPSDPTTYQAVAIEDEIFDTLKEAIEDGEIDLTDVLKELDKVNNLGNSVDNLSSRFLSYIERVSNSIVSAIKNHALTRAVSPIILYNTTDGIKRLVDGTKVKAGIMQINMTSPTEERIVPPYEKYIAVKDASGKITQKATIPGNTQLWTLDLTKAGDYTVILSCVDYYGYVVTKKYEITVK